jgi:NadR type nicotinamide-nucleotide adenylyltransferase
MRRIAITGPESTGKSTLAARLADHYHTIWIPEFARSYIDGLRRDYTYEDVEIITLEQMKQEDEQIAKAHDLIFVDTELLVIKIWMEHAFKKIPAWLEEEIAKRTYDLYLLCNIDIPWEYDPQREHPDLRKHFFDLYKKELIRRNFNYTIVSGDEEKRFEIARKAIEN